MDQSNAMNKWGIAPLSLFKIALVLWVLPLLVICARAYCNPTANTVTLGYSLASEAWWGGGKVYIGPGGMNYLPHFAIIFSLFDALPAPFGEILWRIVAFALLATGLWRFCRRLFADVYTGFFWTTILTLPLSLAALRNGQANAVFAGIVLHALVSLASKKWGWAAGLIALSVAVKPLGIVLVLLAPFVYRPLWWRMLLAVSALLAFPFLFARPGFVFAQYHDFIRNLGICSIVNDNSYADIGGVFRQFGVEFPPLVSKTVRVLAGLPTLVLWIWGALRLREPLRELWLLALAGGYLMLFNPMNEANSYVIMAPAFAMWAVWLLANKVCRGIGWGIVFITYTMSVWPLLLHPWFGTRFALFWHPVMTVVFIALLIPVIARLGRMGQVEPV